ncbi:hypothetical protein [Thiomicrorhabdus sp.]|uniref:hypothetical protein n=1 Tax=Thiomicrorhabdus sp. TaxID=2039724 RepID=UPI0029C60151|nr:hypothetical protein [Thiomicrorhabdus sp.]
MSEIGWLHPVDEADQWDGFNDSGIEHFRGDPLSNLAREVIQNAMDAGLSGSIVKVDILLKSIATNDIPNINELKANIESCLEASEFESDKAKTFFENALNQLSKNSVKVLEISDYNTTGMKGPAQNGTPYYAFMKARGQSKKLNDTAGGSYGIGKFAPYAVSQIRTIFVSTIYEDEENNKEQLTQAKSLLMSHEKEGKRRQAIGYWGLKDKCMPVKGFDKTLSEVLVRSTSSDFSSGTKLVVLAFDDSNKHWEELLAASIAENFFGAINKDELIVNVNEKYRLDGSSLADLFENQSIIDAVEKSGDGLERFSSRKYYLEALNSNIAFCESTQNKILGHCELRVLVDESLPSKVCALRNGMFITEQLRGLMRFSGFKDFVAVFECTDPTGNELLRSMEPPRHDSFEPERLDTQEMKAKGNKALNDIAKWVRGVLQKLAKEPSSEVTSVDELKEFFGYEDNENSVNSEKEINPFGNVVWKPRPIKVTMSQSKLNGSVTSTGDGDSQNGGGPLSDNGGNEGSSGGGNGENGVNGTSGGEARKSISIKNIRSVILPTGQRSLAFTPNYSGEICLSIFECGDDQDYFISVVQTDLGEVTGGRINMAVEAGQRYNIKVNVEDAFDGAIKVVANEV